MNESRELSGPFCCPWRICASINQSEGAMVVPRTAMTMASSIVAAVIVLDASHADDRVTCEPGSLVVAVEGHVFVVLSGFGVHCL